MEEPQTTTTEPSELESPVPEQQNNGVEESVITQPATTDPDSVEQGLTQPENQESSLAADEESPAQPIANSEPNPQETTVQQQEPNMDFVSPPQGAIEHSQNETPNTLSEAPQTEGAEPEPTSAPATNQVTEQVSQTDSSTDVNPSHTEKQPTADESTPPRQDNSESSRPDNQTFYRNRLVETLTLARQRRVQLQKQRLTKILQFIVERKTLVTAKEIRERLKLPQSTVTDYLAELVLQGKVLRLGAKRRSTYRLTQGV